MRSSSTIFRGEPVVSAGFLRLLDLVSGLGRYAVAVGRSAMVPREGDSFERPRWRSRPPLLLTCTHVEGAVGMKGGRSRGKTATTGPHACGCWDAVAAQYGVDRFGITTIPIRQRQFRRPATYVPAPL